MLAAPHRRKEGERDDILQYGLERRMEIGKCLEHVGLVDRCLPIFLGGTNQLFIVEHANTVPNFTTTAWIRDEAVAELAGRKDPHKTFFLAILVPPCRLLIGIKVSSRDQETVATIVERLRLRLVGISKDSLNSNGVDTICGNDKVRLLHNARAKRDGWLLWVL